MPNEDDEDGELEWKCGDDEDEDDKLVLAGNDDGQAAVRVSVAAFALDGTAGSTAHL